jgi:two-component sensor histidine kinase
MWAPDGRLIARTKLSLEQVERPFVSTVLAERAARQKSGTFRTISAVDGIDRIIAYRAIEDWPVIVTASVPVDSALADWWSGLWWSAGAILVLLAALAGFTLVALRLSRREEAALADLTAANAALDARQQELSATNATLRSALADKELLLREIHHRVKNNLQTVASLLRIQARRSHTEATRDALTQAMRRVAAIAVVHDTLSEGLTQNVDFDVVFSRVLMLIAEVASSHNTVVRPTSTGSFGTLPSEYATPLALALTELVTNAVEHGLTGRPDGEVEIIASRTDKALSVKVRDNGCGMPEGKVGSGLGTQIVRTLIQGELGGTIDWHTLEGEGTEVTIDMPLLYLKRRA